MKTFLVSFLSLFILSNGFSAELSDKEIAYEIVKHAQRGWQSFVKVDSANTIGDICFKAAWADGSLGNMLFIHNEYHSMSFYSANPSYLEKRQKIHNLLTQNKTKCEKADETSVSVIKANSSEVAELLGTVIRSMNDAYPY